MRPLCIVSIFEIAHFIAYDNQEQVKTMPYVCTLQLIAWCLHLRAEYTVSVRLQVIDDF